MVFRPFKARPSLGVERVGVVEGKLSVNTSVACRGEVWAAAKTAEA